ncbi:MAG: outer membrane protein transport protein [Odoribacteraceae bacterium]|jgi:long-subunit fatty acid transport protein|nr:outer membrane protein transport protein [Odoribacteraceae bacterium]
MNKRAILLVACLTGSLVAAAQDPVSILQFSRLYPRGTARSAAMSGAFGALGGDLSAVHVNPAGVGVFRKSEFNFTPFLDFDRATSVDKANKTTLLLGNAGYVINFFAPRGPVRSVNIAFNYTNMNNFNRDILQYGGVNTTSSLIDVWYEQANGHERNELDAMGDPSLAYDVALINLKANSTNEYYRQLSDGDNVEQERAITERGYQGEYAIATGINLNDKLYIGSTLGTQIIRYRYRGEYREKIDSPTSPLDDFSRVGIFETNGSGVNFKVGVIYRPTPEHRVGIAIHTPTYYTLSAYNESALHSSFHVPPLAEGTWTRFDSSTSSEYNYELSTPWRFIASIAAVQNKNLIVSLDYEYVDYPSSDLTDTYRGEYDWIRDFFRLNTRAASNLRVGIEYRANSLLSLRAGYAYNGSPYAKDDWNARARLNAFSAGLGFNLGSFYSDIAYTYKTATDTDYFYNYATGDGHLLSSREIKTTFNASDIRYSIGIRF